MDLTPYIAKGFPGNLDQAIANVGVAGIDREQTLSMIRLCPETEEELYGGSYSPTVIRYRKGSRPVIEAIAADFPSHNQRDYAIAARRWVRDTVIHPHLVEPTAPDRALSEEDLIESGIGWCNEQARVFIALCEVAEIPARLFFINHINAVCGHTATEVYLDGGWAFFDVTFDLSVLLPEGRMAEGRELMSTCKNLAHEAYRPALEEYFAATKPYVHSLPNWGLKDRPHAERGGDLLGTAGVCNYIIRGAEPVTGH